MTTAIKPETIPWGERKSTHEAIPFYDAPGCNALANGQKWVAEGNPEEKRQLASMREVLKEMVRTRTSLPFGITTNSEEIFGLDTEGRIGEKGEAIMLTLHGNGIILQNPQSLRATYVNRTPKGEPSVRQEKITAALSGILPNGQQIEVYTWGALSKKDAANLPQVYAVAQPLKDVEGTPSGLIDVGKLPTNRIYVARAGHITTAEAFAQTLQDASVDKYGNWHTLKNAEPKNPSGRVLHANYYRGVGLGGGNSISNGARFVGVRQGAEGAAPLQASTLDELIGTGTDVGGGLVVVRADQISPAAYKCLTGQTR